jgi:DNA-directed RNA polymerase specialized sigma24 family protein
MAEIAAATEQPVGTVKSLLHRAKCDLRRYLEAELDYGVVSAGHRRG